ncbi:MAG: S8 family serine peptidase [Pseudomonadota bacterium]|nr:S8 family serine peptidase [Pseudomonadota bacterium]
MPPLGMSLHSILAFCIFAWTLQVPAVAAEAIVGAGVVAAVGSGTAPVLVVALERPKPAPSDAGAVNAAIASAQQAVLDALDASDYTLVHRYRSLSALTLIVRTNSALKKLAAHPLVRRIDLDVGGSGTLNQSRPWIGADLAHAAGINGGGQAVAVLDSGIDTNHPDLAGDLVHEHCVCNTGIDCCPTGGSSGDGPGSAEDDNGHGTHVSGIITSSGGVAPLGIAPDAGIVAVKVLDQNGSFCCSADIAAALDWVLNNRPDVDVVNMSLSTFDRFGSDCDNSTAWTMVLADAVDALRTQGVLSIASSGNDGDKAAMGAPACLSGAIAVGATFDSSDLIASYSNSSPSLDLLAPGNSITSTMVGGGQETSSGTSMAAPHAAALAALISQRKPAATPNEVADCLATSPVQITDTNFLSRPRIDVPSALDACAPATSGPYLVHTIAPCRVLDTRLGSPDFDRLAPNETLSILVAGGGITGQGGSEDCGIPEPAARGLYLNVAAVQPPGAQQLPNPSSNFLTLYPSGAVPPLASSINYAPDSFALANGLFVPMCDDLPCPWDLEIFNGPSAYVDVVIDVTGYVAAP